MRLCISFLLASPGRSKGPKSDGVELPKTDDSDDEAKDKETSGPSTNVYPT